MVVVNAVNRWKHQSVCLAFCLVWLSFSFVETGAAPSEFTDDSTSAVVHLEPVAAVDFDGRPVYPQSLSSGRKALLVETADRRLSNSLLIILNPDKTRRPILARGFVLRMRCAGDKIYSRELAHVLSRRQRDAEILRAAKAAGDDWEYWDDEVKIPRSHEIRQYDPATGTSRTLQIIQDRRHFLDFFPSHDRVYLFWSRWDEATQSSDIRITTLPLSGEAKETTCVIPTASRTTWPGHFVVRDGWLYYRAGLSERPPRSPDNPHGSPDYAVYRANLATGETQQLAEDRSLASFCVTEKPETLVYLAERTAKDRDLRAYVLRAVSLDGSFPGRAELTIDAIQARLYYDKVEKAAMLFVEFGATLHRGLYRVSIEE